MPVQPDQTAVLVALWRALHLELDPPPHVLTDRLGLDLAAPAADWREQPAMAEEFSRPLRSVMVGRARLVEDTVAARLGAGVTQYVILGAGLDTFGLRRPDCGLAVFEVDEPGTQAWKRHRIGELGWALPPNLAFVPLDFETRRSWVEAIGAAGFDPTRPAVVSCMGVAQYITSAAIATTMREVCGLAPGSLFICSFNPPDEMVPRAERPLLAAILKMVSDRGCPWISRYTPQEFTMMADAAGFAAANVVDSEELTRRYFADRPDGLRPTAAELFLIASVDRTARGIGSTHP